MHFQNCELSKNKKINSLKETHLCLIVILRYSPRLWSIDSIQIHVSKNRNIEKLIIIRNFFELSARRIIQNNLWKMTEQSF